MRRVAWWVCVSPASRCHACVCQTFISFGGENGKNTGRKKRCCQLVHLELRGEGIWQHCASEKERWNVPIPSSAAHTAEDVCVCVCESPRARSALMNITLVPVRGPYIMQQMRIAAIGGVLSFRERLLSRLGSGWRFCGAEPRVGGDVDLMSSTVNIFILCGKYSH